MGQINLIDNTRQFMLAGNALFTIKNNETNGRFTFKIKRAKNNNKLFFVSLLNGPDNYSNYQYMGIIKNGIFMRTAKSRISEDATSFKAFNWLWHNVDCLPAIVSVHHEGRCGRCGRRLTVPESIESGFGPECAGRI